MSLFGKGLNVTDVHWYVKVPHYSFKGARPCLNMNQQPRTPFNIHLNEVKPVLVQANNFSGSVLFSLCYLRWQSVSDQSVYLFSAADGGILHNSPPWQHPPEAFIVAHGGWHLFILFFLLADFTLGLQGATPSL